MCSKVLEISGTILVYFKKHIKYYWTESQFVFFKARSFVLTGLPVEGWQGYGGMADRTDTKGQ